MAAQTQAQEKALEHQALDEQRVRDQLLLQQAREKQAREHQLPQAQQLHEQIPQYTIPQQPQPNPPVSVLLCYSSIKHGTLKTQLKTAVHYIVPCFIYYNNAHAVHQITLKTRYARF